MKKIAEMAVQEKRTSPGEKVLLTIAIPTYNRAVYLRQLLQVLLDQLRGETRVELIISDNATPDETPAVVEEFVSRGLGVRYLRNEVNIGPDANFLQCFQMASGKYVWIFGDDDIIVPGGISKVLTLLTEGEYSLIYLSPYWFQQDYAAERKSDYFGRFAEEYRGGLQFVRRVGTMISFISSMIVNKEQFSASLHNKDFFGPRRDIFTSAGLFVPGAGRELKQPHSLGAIGRGSCCQYRWIRSLRSLRRKFQANCGCKT